MTKHILPELPYVENALEPYISAETLSYHYGKHHASYVDKLNKQIEGTEFESATLEEIIMKASGGIFNNGAQVWNHNFYWNCLNPEGGGAPKNELSKSIDIAFNSFDAFKEKFSKAAVGNFGSGWTWLCRNKDGSLEIVNTSNADNPMTSGKQPLMTCDVWEHAYYIDYRNARSEYIDAYWKLINWNFIEQKFENW